MWRGITSPDLKYLSDLRLPVSSWSQFLTHVLPRLCDEASHCQTGNNSLIYASLCLPDVNFLLMCCLDVILIEMARLWNMFWSMKSRLLRKWFSIFPSLLLRTLNFLRCFNLNSARMISFEIVKIQVVGTSNPCHENNSLFSLSVYFMRSVSFCLIAYHLVFLDNNWLVSKYPPWKRVRLKIWIGTLHHFPNSGDIVLLSSIHTLAMKYW